LVGLLTEPVEEPVDERDAALFFGVLALGVEGLVFLFLFEFVFVFEFEKT
jgi:hypothetical protein